jgi:hypothetical protein
MWDYGANRVTGLEWVVVAVAFLVDVGAHRGTARGRD